MRALALLSTIAAGRKAQRAEQRGMVHLTDHRLGSISRAGRAGAAGDAGVCGAGCATAAGRVAEVGDGAAAAPPSPRGRTPTRDRRLSANDDSDDGAGSSAGSNEGGAPVPARGLPLAQPEDAPQLLFGGCPVETTQLKQKPYDFICLLTMMVRNPRNSYRCCRCLNSSVPDISQVLHAAVNNNNSTSRILRSTTTLSKVGWTLA